MSAAVAIPDGIRRRGPPSPKGGRKEPFGWVRRGYSNLRLVARAKSLTLNYGDPEVARLSRTIHREIEDWRLTLSPEEREHFWSPRPRIYERLLGLLHTGVKLEFHKGEDKYPCPEWSLSGNELKTVLGLSRSTLQLLFRYLGDCPIRSPLTGKTVGNGLGYIERIQQRAPMRVKFARPDGALEAPLPDGSNCDAVVELNGPAVTRLSAKGLCALGLPEDTIEIQKARIAYRLQTGSDPRLGKLEARNRAKPDLRTSSLRKAIKRHLSAGVLDSGAVAAVKKDLPDVPEAEIVDAVQRERYLRKVRPSPSYRPHRKVSKARKEPTLRKDPSPPPLVDPRAALETALEGFEVPVLSGRREFSCQDLAKDAALESAEKFASRWSEQTYAAGGMVTPQQEEDVFLLAYQAFLARLQDTS